MPNPPRIALVGFALESNAFAPPATEADFRRRGYFEGESILREVGSEVSGMPMEMVAFVRTMAATGPWDPVPVIVTHCEPWGPVEHEFFDRTVTRMTDRLRAAKPIDAVYIANHGAMTSTETHDPDGEMMARLRDAVGPGAAVIATLDLHANASERMVRSTDVVIGYQTNPHVDMYERGEEAAHCVRAMLAGMRPRAAFIRLPLTPVSLTLLTREGPYADLIDYGQRRKRELGGAILNVTVLGGFVFSDSPKNGVCVIVTARRDLGIARKLAREIAERGWSERARFRKDLTPLEEAVRLAVAAGKDPTRPALMFSDAGDNPGGGGTGTTTSLLSALLEAGARGVLFGSFFDPALAAEAHERGQGAQFRAVFNRSGDSPFARRLETEARVQSLGDGNVVGRRGIYAERALELGPSCVLSLGRRGEIAVVVISARKQTADPLFFEQFGLDVASARTVCVKSRGHFRAGFDEWFAPGQIYEVDTPGLTAPVLDRFDWRGLPRPVYPLDEDAEWAPPDW